jgi:hypothetical protein
MTLDYDHVAFKEWLNLRKGLSKKASGDVISRLNRCQRIESIEGFEIASTYLDALLQNPLLDGIPETSRSSMFRSAKLFYEFRNN